MFMTSYCLHLGLLKTCNRYAVRPLPASSTSVLRPDPGVAAVAGPRCQSECGGVGSQAGEPPQAQALRRRACVSARRATNARFAPLARLTSAVLPAELLNATLLHHITGFYGFVALWMANLLGITVDRCSSPPDAVGAL
jgi:hypothetical protein